ncbi:MAG: histidine--tRNA ligase [Patescibacteria group bacterium]
MAKIQPINRLKGFQDITPEDTPYWDFVTDTLETGMLSAGFDRIETPILERADLFDRGVGPDSDIVNKEMYSFDTAKMAGKDKKATKDGTIVSLRPELTAGVVRAYIEHGMQILPKPVALFTMGRCFRHENPQAGRYREFTQFGAEIFGEIDPLIDALLISNLWQTMNRLGIPNLVLNVNSLGSREDRPKIKKALTEYFKKKESKLCDDCKKRLKKNPLRILDCKEDKCQTIVSSAPAIVDLMSDDCRTHFMTVLEHLDDMEIPYNLMPTLVRGLDYYSRTVFEFSTKDDHRRTASLGGGGRYDYLVEELGGPETPAIGFGVGVDRIVDFLKTNLIKIPKPKSRVSVYVVHLGEESKKLALGAVMALRKLDISTGVAIGRDTLKGQLKAADKVGALYTVIIGQREAMHNVAMIRDMRDGIQETVDISDLAEKLYHMVKLRTREEEDYGKKIKNKANQ